MKHSKVPMLEHSQLTRPSQSSRRAGTLSKPGVNLWLTGRGQLPDDMMTNNATLSRWLPDSSRFRNFNYQPMPDPISISITVSINPQVLIASLSADQQRALIHEICATNAPGYDD